VHGHNRMLRADLIQIVTIRMTLFRNHGVVIVGTLYPVPGFGIVSLHRKQPDKISHVFNRAERGTVQIDVEEVNLALTGKVAVPVNETGQHGFAAQIDNFVDLGLIKIALRLGVGFGTHKNDLAVQCGNDFGFLGVIDVLGLLHRFRNGINFTIMVYGISQSVGSVQLHTAAENHRHNGRERQRLLLYTVFHECSSCKKLTLPGAFLLVPFPDSDSRKAYFPDFG